MTKVLSFMGLRLKMRLLLRKRLRYVMMVMRLIVSLFRIDASCTFPSGVLWEDWTIMLCCSSQWYGSRFWTFTQQRIMEDVYHFMPTRKRIAKPKSIYTKWISFHMDTALLLRDMLESLALWTLVCLNQDYWPLHVQLFYWTVYYHTSGRHDITWMCGNHKISSTKREFANALGGM
jgi:hypothetical protein